METERLDYYLNRLDGAISGIARRMASGHGHGLGKGLTWPQFFALRVLERRGQCQVSELAECLGVSLSATTGIVDRLYRSKLVTRERDEKDRRVVWVRPTEVGSRLLKEVEARRRERMSQTLGRLDEADLVKLVEVMEKVLGLIESDGHETHKRED